MTNVNGSEPAPQEVVCLFLVVLDADGSSRVVLNTNERFLSQRLATPKDVYPCLANVLADFQGLKTAEAIMSMQLTMAQQFQQPAQEHEEESS